MEGTPRMRSAYPMTPDAQRQKLDRAQPGTIKLPEAPRSVQASSSSSAPTIPLTVVDAPTQRLYAVAIWCALLVWRLYDWASLLESDDQSLGLFAKWAIIDVLFFHAVPQLHIPWLEWTSTTSLCLFGVHAVATAMLMFRLPLPIEGALMLLARSLYASDREYAISENKVSPQSILNNASLIMGKQIINILPEGSATLNPRHLPFCLDDAHAAVKLPLVFNETVPELVELLRFDPDTNTNETITLSRSERKQLRPLTDQPNVHVLYYSVKKTGIYRLHKVVDELHLEVQCRPSDTLVVTCPRASVSSSGRDRCVGDLSNLAMELEGTPPLKVVYSRSINDDDTSFHFQRNHPDGFTSPLMTGAASDALVPMSDVDVSWARSHRVIIPINESMTVGGSWLYSVDEIHDAAGNTFNYSSRGADGEHIYPKGSHLERTFVVHERPVVSLPQCDFKSPLMVAKGASKQLPVVFGSTGKMPDDTSHVITYKFSALDTLTSEGDHGEDAIMVQHRANNAHHLPEIKMPGLYTLEAVSTSFCTGEVKEPASCLLLNPPVPELAISAENIHDKCAGNPIGLLVNLDLTGTPPFVLQYEVTKASGIHVETRQIVGLRSQLELKPSEAGLHKYKFTGLRDAVYGVQPLAGKDMTLEQNVRPPATARFRSNQGSAIACIDEPMQFAVELHGEPPFNVEYEIVHDGKRKKHKVQDVRDDILTIKTDPLNSGGKYSMILASVQDGTGCKTSLDETLDFTVRHQRPKASFAHIDGKFDVMAVEGQQVSLPVRLTGEGPWRIRYRHSRDGENDVVERRITSSNGHLDVKEQGTYELVSVSDSQCRGSVESIASTFVVDWIPRPHIGLADVSMVVLDNGKYVKGPVCEGDIDSFDIKLTGSPPFHVRYAARMKPLHGSSTIRNREFDAALEQNTIPMDTSRAGVVDYTFEQLSDARYDHGQRASSSLVVQQNVNARPSAQFADPGKSYNYCKIDVTGEEIIPITFTGKAPFYLEVDVKHRNKNKAETMTFPNIPTARYDLRIPKGALALGVHSVSIRKVRDGNGCHRKLDFKVPTVQVHVFDEPLINPLESRTDYCVGDRIAYTLSGQAPFEIQYTFQGKESTARSPSNTFKRIAEKPGNFSITAVSDKASHCKSKTAITRIIHELPSVKVSEGRQVKVDIHEGHKADILFEFWGTPPFEFTYTRSTNQKKGRKSEVLETRHEVSHEHSMIIPSSLEGTYEVVAIRDKYCAVSTGQETKEKPQKLLPF